MTHDEAIRIAAARAPLDQLVAAIREAGRELELKRLIDGVPSGSELRSSEQTRSEHPAEGISRVEIRRVWRCVRQEMDAPGFRQFYE